MRGEGIESQPRDVQNPAGPVLQQSLNLFAGGSGGEKNKAQQAGPLGDRGQIENSRGKTLALKTG